MENQPEPCWIDANGKPQDEGLHDSMLNDNPQADAVFARDCIEAAVKQGMDPAKAIRLYWSGTETHRNCAR